MIERFIPAIQLQVQSGQISFRFEGQDAMYRDFDGRRVVADFEGIGSFSASGNVDCFLDGNVRGELSGEFSNWLRVVAREPGSTLVEVQAPAFPGVELQPVFAYRIDEPGPRHQNRSAIRQLSSKLPTGEMHEGPVASFLNRLEFELELPGPVVIARLYDRFHGRQRCRVLVDGIEQAIWFSPWEDRELRWAIDHVALPNVAPGRHSLVFDPSAGYPLWSLSELLVLAMVTRPE